MQAFGPRFAVMRPNLSGIRPPKRQEGLRLLPVVGLLATGWGCTLNADNPAGFEYSGRELSSIRSDTLTAASTDTSWLTPLELAGADQLFIGRYRGFESMALLRFEGIPAGATIEQARLTLTRRARTAAEDSIVALEISAHPVGVAWDSSWTGNERSGLLLDPPVATASLPFAATTDTIGFTLPVGLVQSWVDDPAAARRGLALEAAQGGSFMAYFDASGTSGSRGIHRVRLRIRYVPAAGGAARVTTVYPSLDLSLMTHQGPVPPGELWIARGAVRRAMVGFDISDIPPGSTVNRAELRLAMEADGVLQGPIPLFAAAPIDEQPWFRAAGSQWVAGTASGQVAVTVADSLLTLVVTRAVAHEIARGSSRIHLLVAASGESAGIGLVRLHNRHAAAAPARLTLVVSLVPEVTP
jgi:hypothetical protein